jgi:hypothetical protein
LEWILFSCISPPKLIPKESFLYYSFAPILWTKGWTIQFLLFSYVLPTIQRRPERGLLCGVMTMAMWWVHRHCELWACLACVWFRSKDGNESDLRRIRFGYYLLLYFNLNEYGFRYIRIRIQNVYLGLRFLFRYLLTLTQKV